MIHTASLVHDDVLDEADTRRGEIACFDTRCSPLQFSNPAAAIMLVAPLLHHAAGKHCDTCEALATAVLHCFQANPQ